MLTLFKKGTVALVSMSLVLLPHACLPAQAKPVRGNTTGGTSIYQKAERQLPQNWYVMYRVVDRIARANGLDQHPWRVVILPKYDVNAFATEENLVAVYTGILDQLAGDSSAMACVVGHEMGHHVEHHLVVGQTQKEATIAQAKADAERQAKQEISHANTDMTLEHIGGGLLGGLFGGQLGSTGSSLLGGASNQRAAIAQKRVEQIVAKKQKELDQQIAAAQRQRELEADRDGYLFSTRAGFDPQGCIRAMNALSQIPGSDQDTDHPAVANRIKAFQALMVQYPPQTLAAEGKAKIAAVQPLTYDLSEDGESLRINSVRGGSAAADIDHRFGN